MHSKASSAIAPVRAWVEDLLLPTYLPAAPDKNPMFLEKRVYQGSSGRVYPLPFTDRIAEKPVDRRWKAVWLENEFLRVLLLPELGGRIHAIQDRTNGYDLIYRQEVIKPALVGLAGPWISGGIEFNWPQHHRPATFLPAAFEIEEHPDGSRTVWCSDHDPMTRMKGMHGVCLQPGRAVVELKVRAYNRTPQVQTFLWWANVATRVHEAYQSFFPPDVYYVADHARRSMSEYPLAKGVYYGVNYGARGKTGVPPEEVPSQFLPPHCRSKASDRNSRADIPDYAPNDLSFYANIPVPTSYMCMGSQEDFFGGYDYAAQAGIIHVANHHISPGKKQWTWGNHAFGYAWDRNLTEPDAAGEYAPYIEIMAGVYTDNQPDFSFLQPGETRTWSQYWYPIQRMGPAQCANLNAAVSLVLHRKQLRVGVCVTRHFGRGCLRLERADGTGAATWPVNLAPGQPYVMTAPQPRKPFRVGHTVLRVLDSAGREIISFRSQRHIKGAVPPPATEPPPAQEIASNDELFVTGLHLEQYRHATRCPTLYWREGLRRDPLDARCNNALGRWHLRRGEFSEAEQHFRCAIQRLTLRNANPADGEAYYNLGQCLRHLGRDADAYAAFYKATWNQGWASASYHVLAELDCCRHDWAQASDHLDRSLRLDTENLRARNLKVLVLRRLGSAKEATALLEETLGRDRLDWWARHLAGQPMTCDLQAGLDAAHDYARAGFIDEAVGLLRSLAAPKRELPDQSWGALPLVRYTLGWLEQRRGNDQAARAEFRKAAAVEPDYCFPVRLEEIAVFETAIRANPRDARAPYYLGNLLYDRRRHQEAIRCWELSVRLNPRFSTVWRNLGIGYYNIHRKPAKAKAAYDRACRLAPADARLVYERDQLWKRLGEKPEKRLRELKRRLGQVHQRDDLSVELCSLYNQTGQPERALALVSSRKFQPWEGGEGGPLGQHVRSHLALGQAALAQGNGALARRHFEAALGAPENLGEARHLLANQSDIHYWLGMALSRVGERELARRHWHLSATFTGDFQEMSVRAFSEMTYYSALSWERLGRRDRAQRLFRDLLSHARQLRKAEAKIDYFATSLPTMLLFEDDLQSRQDIRASVLEAQAWLGSGRVAKAKALLKSVLARDPNHPLADELLRTLTSPQQVKSRA
jgi:tetratricopeptide (TPR) repeat protein